jgi:hypothetical protein
VTLTAKWFGTGRPPRCPADPEFPNGLDVDLSRGAPACEVRLRYPATSTGQWLIGCDVCGFLGVVTAAGRRDDPRSVKVACLTKGTA